MPLVILGIILLLLLLAQGYAYKKLWDRGLGYRAQFSAKEAFEGDRLFLREEITNMKFLPLPWVFVKLTLSDHITFVNSKGDPLPNNIPSSLYALMSYRGIRRRKPFVCSKRGVYNLRNANVVVSNLLHSREYNKDFPFPLRGELLVFPKLLDNNPHIDILFKQMDAAVLSKRLINPDPFEFRGIREYQPTDPLRNVNFKATAVAQQLMVNIHAPTAAQRLTLALNLEDMYAPADQHEDMIRLTATMARYFDEQDAVLNFYTNGRYHIGHSLSAAKDGTTIPTASLYEIYEILARLTLGVQCTPLTEYMNQLTDREQIYVFITSYFGEDLQEAFNSLPERGIDAFLIVTGNTNDISLKDIHNRNILLLQHYAYKGEGGV